MSTAAPTPEHTPVGNATLPPLEQLPNDAETLKRMVLELLATLHSRDRELEGVRHRIELLLRRLYGSRSERLDPNQPLLFDEPAEVQDTAPASTAASKSKRRCRPHGRRPLPDNLPRRPVHHELTEAERVCSCGQVRVDIGVDTSEQVDWQPASLFVWQHLTHKYACPACAKKALAATPTADQPMTEAAEPVVPTTAALAEATAQRFGPVVIAASKPEMPIAKGLPGAGLLAYLIVSKFFDHLPLYRLERICERQGLLLPRSTTCDWLAASATRLRPLYDLMVTLVLQSRWLHTDDTPVKNQQPAPEATATSRLWAYLGDRLHPYNVFDFTATRQRDGPQQFLADFQGYLHADAFSGYDGLYLPQPRGGGARIIEVACNAHARRKFYNARTSDAARSHQALAYYTQLYEIERQAKDKDDTQRLQMRQDLAVPILDRFHTWLERQRVDVLPKSPMGEALGYALNNWTALIRYTEAGFLAIDNNVAEREMKRIAIGRKNWLFVGSDQGGKTAAVLISFTSTCARLGVEPWAYLQDVLTRLPTTAAAHLADLLPDRWLEARKPAAANTPVVAEPTAVSAFCDSLP